MVVHRVGTEQHEVALPGFHEHPYTHKVHIHSHTTLKTETGGAYGPSISLSVHSSLNKYTYIYTCEGGMG